MSRWSKSARRKQSRKLKTYWRTVKRVRDGEQVSTAKAREMVRFGIFRGRSIAEETGKRVFNRYQIRRDRRGKVHIEIEKPSGEIRRISQDQLEHVKNLTTYNVMVDRLHEWTGWNRKRIRNYLSQYPQWRDGVSPLFRKRR